MKKNSQAYYTYIMSSAASLLILLGSSLYLESAAAQSSDAVFVRGTSMDAFNRAGEALRRGLLKPQASDPSNKEVLIKTQASNPQPVKKSLPNPLSQLTSYAPQKKRTQKQKGSTNGNRSRKSTTTISSTATPKSALKIQKKHTSSAGEMQRLRAEISQLKQELAVAELEVSRLSDIVQSKSFSTLSSRPANTRAMTPKTTNKPRRLQPVRPAIARAAKSAPAVDMQVATISSAKAHLRLGPSTDHSRLMTLRKGSRLAVETRQGEWYRVFAPNGQRAWIHASLVSFGNGSQSLNDGSAVTTRGFNAKR